MSTCYSCGQRHGGPKVPSKPTASDVRAAERQLARVRASRFRAWSVPAVAIIATYLVLLYDHPLALILTIAVGVYGAVCIGSYVDNIVDVDEAEDHLDEVRERYTEAMLDA